MFIEPAQLPFTAEISASLDVIRDELERHGPGRFRAWYQRGAYDGQWDILALANCCVPLHCPELEEAAAANAAFFPRTLAVLERIPGFALAAFSRLGPGTCVHLHQDADDPPVFRCHLGIVVPPSCTLEIGDDVRHHAPGRWLCFHGAAEHMARNRAVKDRVNLLVDVVRSAYPDAAHSSLATRRPPDIGA